MKGYWLSITLVALAAACAPAGPGEQTPRPAEESAQPNIAGDARQGVTLRPDLAALVAVHRQVRVDGLESRTFGPDRYWRSVLPVLESSERLRVEQVGESAEGRPLRLVTYGDGPVPVLMWSQMHGDEPTASMALADLFAFFARQPDHPAARLVRERLTVHFLPVLNPDGAARFQRRNALGVDVNRDARLLATPEGQALKAVRERVQPVFGFNLHDQDVRTRLGDSDEGVAIALLAPAFDESRAINDVRRRAMKVAAVVRTAIEPLVAGRIARYDDTFTPRAFGDLMTKWGTSTVLIESGGWDDDPEKQHLRMVNFVAFVRALEAIASGSYQDADPALYHALPENGRRVADLKIIGGILAVPGLPRMRGDVLIEYGDAARRTGGRIEDVGDLLEREARDTIDATGLYVVPSRTALEQTEHGTQFAIGAPALLVVSRDAAGRDVVWRIDGGAPVRTGD